MAVAVVLVLAAAFVVVAAFTSICLPFARTPATPQRLARTCSQPRTDLSGCTTDRCHGRASSARASVVGYKVRTCFHPPAPPRPGTYIPDVQIPRS